MSAIRVVSYYIALKLDEELEAKARLEGDKGTLFLPSRQQEVTAQMRVGTIVAIGKGKLSKVDGAYSLIPIPKELRVGMKVCIPPFNLVEMIIPEMGRVVVTNPHAIIGEITE